MAIPYPTMQPPLYQQRSPAPMPSDLLAAIGGGWDPWTAGPTHRVAAAVPPSLGPFLPGRVSPLEGAGRMAQDGGVIGTSSFPYTNSTGPFANSAGDLRQLSGCLCINVT